MGITREKADVGKYVLENSLLKNNEVPDIRAPGGLSSAHCLLREMLFNAHTWSL